VCSILVCTGVFIKEGHTFRLKPAQPVAPCPSYLNSLTHSLVFSSWSFSMAPRMHCSRMTVASTIEDNLTQHAFTENHAFIQVHTCTNSIAQSNIDGTKPNANPPSKFIVISSQIYLNL
jgi:hypothetical protein